VHAAAQNFTCGTCLAVSSIVNASIGLFLL
jgi:hypothetical protein